MLCRDGLSRLASCEGELKANAKLWNVEFSFPSTGSEPDDEDGVEFPESDVMLRARFSGLLGEGRGRITGFAAALGRADRSDSLTLERKGVANGVCC